MPVPWRKKVKPSPNPEFHIRLEQLSNLDPHDGALYSVSWQNSDKSCKGKLDPQPANGQGIVRFDKVIVVTSPVGKKGVANHHHKGSWLELRITHTNTKGKEKPFDKLVLNLLQCSQLSGEASGRITGKRCAAVVSVTCRTPDASQPNAAIPPPEPDRQSVHEQRLEEAEEELSEMQDRPDVLEAELLAKEQEVERLRGQVESLRRMDEELEQAEIKVHELKRQIHFLSVHDPNEAMNMESAIADLESKVQEVNRRKDEELQHMDRDHERQVRRLENQLLSFSLTQEEQEEQITELKARITALREQESADKECGCAVQ
jgi:ribosomal protein L44E